MDKGGHGAVAQGPGEFAMQAGAAGPGVSTSVNNWSRKLGVTLRPWAGTAPLGLLISGAIQAAVCVAFLVYVLPMAHAADLGQDLVAVEYVQRLIWGVGLVFGVMLLIGVAKLIVGVVDLVPRQQVTGRVLSLRERRFADFLPPFVHQMVQQRLRGRDSHVVDNRKVRTEVVLQTPQGLRQWTVRSHRTRRDLVVGSQVRLTVTPLLGHIAKVERQS